MGVGVGEGRQETMGGGVGEESIGKGEREGKMKGEREGGIDKA
jgi:hypothetical protein